MPTFDIRGQIKDYKGEVVQDNAAKPLVDADGKPKVDKDGRAVYPELKWDAVVHRATHGRLKPDPQTGDKGEREMTQEEKELAHKITTRAYANPKKFKLSQDDLDFLLKRVAVIFSPLIYGRAEELFKQKDYAADSLEDE